LLPLLDKKILIGICGGIAAYKVVSLIRLLKKSGAEVRVIVTPSASGFVGKVSLATVSENPVLEQMADGNTGVWTNHVDLGLWADLFLICPLTASSLSKMATGLADNLLIATYLSARCPVYAAPAMDLDMWAHHSTQRNLDTLIKDGVRILEPEEGSLASGLTGKGRMQEPEALHSAVAHHFLSGALQGKKVLITMGPTIEPIDPVRFISNHSTGKMGAELVKAFAEGGAQVMVVSGPVAFDLAQLPAEVTRVHTAAEMYEASLRQFADVDIAVLTAAVADYTPAQTATQKIKKTESEFSIELIKTQDIAAKMGASKQPHQMLVGFALETNNEIRHAREKLAKKNLDAIVLNSMNDPGAGFGHNTNKITILNTKGETFAFDLQSKKDVARDIVNYVVNHLP